MTKDDIKKRPIFTFVIHVNIIGTGNLAWHLAKRFETLSSVRLQQVCGRDPEKLQPFIELARKTGPIDQIKPAHITIVAVSDQAITTVSEQIPFRDELVVHTSGSVPMQALASHNRKGVFYPAQSFSMSDQVDFSQVPICLEYDLASDKTALSTLALALSPNIHLLKSPQRAKLHMAAVFANNFTNYLFTLSKEVCDQHNIPFSLLHPLMHRTVEKATSHNPRAMQTGPAKRGDITVIQQHLTQLDSSAQKEVYALLSTLIQNHYGTEL